MDQQQHEQQILIDTAARELEMIRSVPKHTGAHFPSACYRLMKQLQGNCHCVDCGSPDPEWASVTFGTLICMQCSGKHRGFGVKTSYVKSIRLDTWSHTQVLAMLEGGNEQLQNFFIRHQMGNNTSTRRYHTKAAQFYRTQLTQHVDMISNAGIYQGREVSRKQASTRKIKASSTIKTTSTSTATRSRGQNDRVLCARSASFNNGGTFHRQNYSSPSRSHHQRSTAVAACQ